MLVLIKIHIKFKCGPLQCDSPCQSRLRDYGEIWMRADFRLVSADNKQQPQYKHGYDETSALRRSIPSCSAQCTSKSVFLQQHFSYTGVKTPLNCDCRGAGATTGRKTLFHANVPFWTWPGYFFHIKPAGNNKNDVNKYSSRNWLIRSNMKLLFQGGNKTESSAFSVFIIRCLFLNSRNWQLNS